MARTIQTAMAFIAVLPILALGQTKSDQPIHTTVCEVVKSPASFNGKIVTLRGPIQIAFENFGLSVLTVRSRKSTICGLNTAGDPKGNPRSGVAAT